MTLYLVRHGETAYNRDGRGLGQADIPLTELGIEQAAAVAQRFSGEPVSRVLSSPLSRAFDIAYGIAETHGIAAEACKALIELDVGETEGLRYAEMRPRFDHFLQQWAGDDAWKATMPGGESIVDLAERLDPVVEQLMTGGAQDMVIVSHNFVLRALLCRLLGLDLWRFRSFQLDLASITTLTVARGRATVRSMNDTCHLADLNLA